MTTRYKLETKGFAEYLERLAQAGKDIDKISDEALRAGAEILLVGMKTRVPKDTRNLENHIVVEGPKRDGNYHMIEVGVVHADAETARYGNVQEYGTSSRAAQSYIRPTMDGDMSKARDEMKKVFIAAEVGIEK